MGAQMSPLRCLYCPPLLEAEPFRTGSGPHPASLPMRNVRSAMVQNPLSL